MSNFFVEHTKFKSGNYPSGDIREAFAKHYCAGNYTEADKILVFLASFDRYDYTVFDSRGKIVAYFSLVVQEDMHLGYMASYPVLFITEAYRNNRELLKTIKWYSERFANTHHCRYISKVKHVSPTKRIETIKEVRNVRR